MGASDLVRDDDVTVNGLRLHYREWGDPNEPDLLILHGLTGHAWEFDGLAERLSTHFHVIALNQRGHGSSDWAPSYTPGVMADDIAAVVDALELAPVRVVGHSMGGINGWTFAARYPDLIDRLVIIDVGPDVLEPEEVQNTWLEALEHAQRSTYPDPEAAINEYLGGNVSVTSDQSRRFILNNLGQRSDGGWAWRYDAGGLKLYVTSAGLSAEHWKTLREMSCPALLVRAGDSGVLSVEMVDHMSRELPGTRVVDIPDSGHDIHFDQPERLYQELRVFLDSDLSR